jgi:hypothetical protein
MEVRDSTKGDRLEQVHAYVHDVVLQSGRYYEKGKGQAVGEPIWHRHTDAITVARPTISLLGKILNCVGTVENSESSTFGRIDLVHTTAT